MNPTWVFHPEHQPKIVSEAEANVLYREGWFDTPDKFPSKDEKADLPKRRRRPKEVSNAVEV